ncbi:hypothetical protein AB9Q10_16015 [Streptomyces krungchingensis]|uniref:hypothetical protein n=1 Tax=Streptomyces krungchingensis TaxID=1565034 RepID=UPI003CED1858
MDHTKGSGAPAEPVTEARRTPAAWAGLTALALLVLLTGALVGVFGPLLAIACEACQDGVRTPRHGDALVAVAQGAVPLVTLGTVLGTFLPRGGAKAGGAGLGVLVLLLVVMQALSD